MTIHLACILLGALHLKPGRAGAAIGEDPVTGASPLVAEYEALLLGLRAELTAGAPRIDSAKLDAFLAAHDAVGRVPAPEGGEKLKVPPPRFADSNPAYVEAQARALQVAREIFPDVEGFLEGDELHLKLALSLIHI